ncbi:helix-turn-helix domain-containing protein [Phocaeicola coprocola]|mgnify:FL=1|uniref:helix-turn-helix domain-containing protein n=1 Tax=Phocaeicola coprocola TaxID=310298 RepID=UPI0026731F98|nr:helix-turn-helix domain-containing protein [Phocaeicola coprocola]
MQKNITPLTWQAFLKNKEGKEVLAIDDYFMLSEDMKDLPTFTKPFTLNVSISIICLSGFIKFQMALKRYHAQAPCLLILPATEILMFEEISTDCKGVFLVLSNNLNNDIVSDIDERLQLSYSVFAQPVVPLSTEELECNLMHFHMLSNILRTPQHPHIKKIIQHQLLAFYYQQHSNIIRIESFNKKDNKQEQLCTQFLRLVEENHRKERLVGFYAEKLSLTPKYLSQLIKEYTGKSANDWIDEFVILEAKALLHSSVLSIQQISDKLNFPDQSSFGKYFKVHTGISPKNYRNQSI